MNPKIQLIIADDHEVYRDGLKALLQNCKQFEVTGEASTGKHLLSLCAENLPDVVLTDIVMPVMDGIKATALLALNFPTVRVIALSMFNQDHLILDMLNAGASGYLIKNAHKNEIINAIESVYKNKPYYCSSTSHKLARLIGNSQFGPKANRKICFTEREVDIIRMICEEKTSKEIGDRLNMSSRTAEEYRQRIREKMKVKSTAGIVIYAIKNELFMIEKLNDQ
ncbi:MAG TPA: response regulator transcription factor [Flavitalea sp.]|nr:response regulator transcription factor [Flavitalea sp.]